MAVRDSGPAPPSTNRNNEKIFVTREDVLQKESLFSSPFRDRTAALLQLNEFCPMDDGERASLAPVL